MVLVIGVMTCTLGGCELFNMFKSDEDMIRERIDDFLFALNTGDMEGVFGCMDAKSRNTYEAMLNISEGIMGSLIGFDIPMADLFALTLGTSSGDFASAQVVSIEITSETTAVVTLNMNMSDDRMDLNESVENVPVQMIKEQGDWYIFAQADWSSMF
jgi:hypothetical protein